MKLSQAQEDRVKRYLDCVDVEKEFDNYLNYKFRAFHAYDRAFLASEILLRLDRETYGREKTKFITKETGLSWMLIDNGYYCLHEIRDLLGIEGNTKRAFTLRKVNADSIF